jgi:hypothetical protein
LKLWIQGSLTDLDISDRHRTGLAARTWLHIVRIRIRWTKLNRRSHSHLVEAQMHFDTSSKEQEGQ